MAELQTAAQMRAIEKAAIDSAEVTGLELMERAGRGVVEAIFEERPELARTSYRAVVLCGPGNNGGDGFVIARLLKEWGWAVEVFLYGDAEKLPPDARTNLERWLDLGEVRRLVKGCCSGLIKNSDVLVDALFGTGLERGILGDLAEVVGEIEHHERNNVGPVVVAVDLPSGLCSDSGKVLGGENSQHIKADLTVTFHRAKCGHFLNSGPRLCGSLVNKDIGLTIAGSRNSPLNVVKLQRKLPLAERLGKDRDTKSSISALNKFSHGHALILSGGVGKGGAARMSARGALRIGAGLVTIGCPAAALQENAGRLDAIMLCSVKDGVAVAGFLGDARINALCLGPGMGLKPEKAELVSAALNAKRATVLDADALTLLAEDTELFGMLHEKCVLTPHGGEFARLFPDIAEKLNAPAIKGPANSKVDACREAAARSGCVVLFKGADTVIAAPDGRCTINSAHYERSAPWLATAGSGDVLAGFITGLLARGFDPIEAAETGAWLHVECAREFGPGLIAEDLPEQLPAVFRNLGL